MRERTSAVTSERAEQVERVYHAALAVDGVAREALLDEICAGDAALRREVLSLLEHEHDAQNCLSEPAIDLVARSVTAPEYSLEAGTQVGAYCIVAPIGAGGMGEVYKARDIRLDRIVALKVLPEHLSCNAERRQRFEREARIISKLNHPHICVLHDIGHEGGTDFLVMEYLEGDSLAERLRRGALPLAEVLRYATQIVDGLAKAHQNGIVHRDLKPGNIIVTRDGVAKILDFGVATMRETAAFEEFGTTESDAPQVRTEEGKIAGTAAYMSPEQAEGMRVDARSDIFSFGSLLYELVTGQRPFQGNTTLATLSLILHKEPRAISELAPSVPVVLDKAILRCVAKDPSQRFQYIIELKAVLEGVITELDVRRQLASDQPIASRQAARLADVRGAAFRVGALLILGIALVLGTMYYREREQNTNLRQVAAGAFYQMRALDADLVGLRRRGSSSKDLARASYRRDQLEQEYDRYLDAVGLYAGKSPTERAVMRLARRLGETDLEVPADFYTLSMKVVDKWKTTPRLRSALSRARQGNLMQKNSEGPRSTSAAARVVLLAAGGK